MRLGINCRLSNGRLRPLILALLILMVFVFQACEDRPDDESTSLGTSLESITVTPANPTLSDPTTQQMTATGTYADGSKADITDSVNWVSEYPAVATVGDESSSKGQLETVITGSTTITARSGTVSGTTTVTVSSAQLESIEVTPGYATYATDATPWVQMKATGIYEDGTVLDLTEYATWSSSVTTVATVNNVDGVSGRATRYSATADGTTTITATFNDVSGSTELTLDDTYAFSGNIKVTPFLPTIINEDKQQFRATAVLDDGSAKITQDITSYVVWESDTPATAAISNAEDTPGLTVADDTNTGTLNISCDLDANSSNNASLDVISTHYLYKLQVIPQYRSIAQGIPYQLTAIGIFKETGASNYFSRDLTEWVSWASSDTSLVTISNASGSKGLATLTEVPGAAERSVTITVKSPLLSSLSGSTTLTIASNSLELTSIGVSPSAPTNHIYTRQTFKAYGTYSDGTDSYVQDISDAVIWSSSDTSVAVVSNDNDSAGKAFNRSGGETTISATLGDVSGTSTLTVKGASYTVSTITVSPSSGTVGVGTFLQMSASADFSDGSESFTQDITESAVWSAGITASADISNVEGSRGMVAGLTDGASTSITAEYGGGSATTTGTITASDLTNITSITITATSSESSDGTYQLTATADYSGSTQDVTESGSWTSSRPEVASVSNIPGSKGKLRYNGNGTATITYRLDDESATYSVTVDQ